MKYKIKVEIAKAARKLDVLVNVDDPRAVCEEFAKVSVAPEMLHLIERCHDSGADEQMLQALKAWNIKLAEIMRASRIFEVPI